MINLFFLRGKNWPKKSINEQTQQKDLLEKMQKLKIKT
jgi:hypothetical protein